MTATPPAAPAPTIDRLLNLAADQPDIVLSLLQSSPQLASAQDHHGYSLLHAAASYGHIPFMRALVQQYGVDVNIADEDEETPLFAVESVSVATCLVEELGADINHKNSEDQTAEEKIEGEEEFVLVAHYLRSRDGKASEASASKNQNSTGNDVEIPPRLPSSNIEVKMGTMAEPVGQEPDPEFKRRIEELAARDDFQSEETQKQLRELVEQAIGGLREDEDREVRRRVD